MTAAIVGEPWDSTNSISVSDVLSRGTAMARNHLISAARVQENAGQLWNGALIRGGGCDAQFTDFALHRLGSSAPWELVDYLLDWDGYYQSGGLLLKDCTLARCNAVVYGSSGGLIVSLVNNIVSDSYLFADRAPSAWCNPCLYGNFDSGMPDEYTGYLYRPTTVTVLNNFIRGTSVGFYNNTDPITLAAGEIHNNLVDAGQLYVSDFTGVSADHNAFTGTGPASVDTEGNVTGLTLDFVPGPLGGYYYPTTGNNLATLINAGDASAADRGFFHYTTAVNQTLEGSSTIDIGPHYMALDAVGNPPDFDGDTLADYFEDSNGNGTFEANLDLSDYRNADSDGDGLPDNYEYFITHTDPAHVLTWPYLEPV